MGAQVDPRRFLKNVTTGGVFLFTEILRGRKDMILCNFDGSVEYEQSHLPIPPPPPDLNARSAKYNPMQDAKMDAPDSQYRHIEPPEIARNQPERYPRPGEIEISTEAPEKPMGLGLGLGLGMQEPPKPVEPPKSYQDPQAPKNPDAPKKDPFAKTDLGEFRKKYGAH